MKGTIGEPQANLGAGQKFSPVDVFKQKNGESQTLGFQWID